MNANEQVDRALDAALDLTFPASDPIAVWMPDERVVRDAARARSDRGVSAPARYAPRAAEARED